MMTRRKGLPTRITMAIAVSVSLASVSLLAPSATRPAEAAATPSKKLDPNQSGRCPKGMSFDTKTNECVRTAE